jgi:biotin carboxylase
MTQEFRRPHVVVVNRWRERYAEYERYVDHERCRVSYVSTAVGLASVPPAAAATSLVAATDDLDAVRLAVRTLAERFGAPDAILALKEDDLLVGAELRQEWDCPGQRPHALEVFRDKGAMCAAIVAAGLPVPAFAAAPHDGAVLDFAAEHGWPLIIKPRVGSSSAGVVRLDGPADLAAIRFDGEPLLVQEFRTDPIYHVDGLFDGARVVTHRASRYLNTCLGFRTGSALGSVEVDDAELDRVVGTWAGRFLAALSTTPVVFHLEVFVGTDGHGRPTCTFLEVGARTGGAEIPFLWRQVHGYDLMEAAARIQLGRPAPAVPAVAPVDDGVGGWLLVPAPAERPCRITHSTPMVGRVPGLYAEVVLRPGQVLPLADAYYEHVGGRFRFRGASSAEVERAIAETARHYRVAAEAIEHLDLPVDGATPTPEAVLG